MSKCISIALRKPKIKKVTFDLSKLGKVVSVKIPPLPENYRGRGVDIYKRAYWRRNFRDYP